MPNVFLSIIIPAYNEASTISTSLSTVVSYLQKKSWFWEIIVVDDGSVDETVQKVSEMALLNDNIKMCISSSNQGKGDAVKKGMLFAKGEWRFLCDADLSMPISNIEHFFSNQDHIPYYDLTLGSRELPASKRYNEPWQRHMFGRLFNLFVKLFMFKGIEDTQCGFKMFSAASSKAIFPLLSLKGFAFDVEAIFIANKLGFSVGEVGIEWHHRRGSKVSFISGAKAFFDVLTLRVRYLFRKDKSDFK